MSDQVVASKKAKTTVYMTEEEEILLNELFSSLNDSENAEKPINLRFFSRVFVCYLRKKSGARQMAKKTKNILNEVIAKQPAKETLPASLPEGYASILEAITSKIRAAQTKGPW